MIAPFVTALAIIVSTPVVIANAIRVARSAKRQSAILVLIAGLVVALITGIGLGVFGEFAINEKMRIQGVPIPLVIFVREGENWTDFVKPPFIGYTCILANALFPVELFALCWPLFAARSPPSGGTEEKNHTASSVREDHLK